MSKLTNFRVAVLATDGFEEAELTEPVRIWNLLIVAFARNGTVIPHGEFLIEPDFHRLAVFIGIALPAV